MEPSSKEYKGVSNFFEKLLNPAFTDQKRFQNSSKTKWAWLSIGTGIATFGIAHAIYHGGKGIAKGSQALYDWGSKKMERVDREKNSSADKVNTTAIGESREKELGEESAPLAGAYEQNRDEANKEYHDALNQNYFITLKKEGAAQGIEVREVFDDYESMGIQKPNGIDIIVFAIQPSPTTREKYQKEMERRGNDPDAMRTLESLKTKYEVSYYKEGSPSATYTSYHQNLKKAVKEAKKRVEDSKQQQKTTKEVQERNREYIKQGGSPEKGIFVANNFAEAVAKLNGQDGNKFEKPCAIYVDNRNKDNFVLLEKDQTPRLVRELIEEEVNKIPRGILRQEPSPNEAFFEKAKNEGRAAQTRDGGSYEQKINKLALNNKRGAYIVDINGVGFRCRIYLDKKGFVEFDVPKSDNLEQAIQDKTVESERLYREFNEHFEHSELHHAQNYLDAKEFVKNNPDQCCIYKSSTNSAIVKFIGPHEFKKAIRLGEDLQGKIKQYKFEALQSASKSPVQESVSPMKIKIDNEAFFKEAMSKHHGFVIKNKESFKVSNGLFKEKPGRVIIAKVLEPEGYLCRHHIDKGIYQDFELTMKDHLENAIAEKMKQNNKRYENWNGGFEYYKKLENDDFAVLDNKDEASSWMEGKSRSTCCMYKSPTKPGVIQFLSNDGTQKEISFNNGDDLTEKIEEFRALAKESARPTEKAGGD